MSYANLRKKRKSISDLAEKMDSSGGFKKDDRYYYPELEKDGSGSAVIRFLDMPPCDIEKYGEDVATPVIKTFNHGFQEKGGWYIEQCPTTIQKDCPVCTYNSEAIADTGIPYKDLPKGNPVKEGVSNRKRKTQFISNILVVSDPKNPENEGKVFLFRYGTIIMDMLMRAAKPKFEDEVKVDAYDMIEGANFKLRIEKVKGQTNYDSSKFDDRSPIAPTDDAIEAIWTQAHSLQEFLQEEAFKPYAKLEERLNTVLRKDKTNVPSAASMDQEEVNQMASDKQELPEAVVPTEGDGADPMDYFRSLAENAD